MKREIGTGAERERLEGWGTGMGSPEWTPASCRFPWPSGREIVREGVRMTPPPLSSSGWPTVANQTRFNLLLLLLLFCFFFSWSRSFFPFLPSIYGSEMPFLLLSFFWVFTGTLLSMDAKSKDYLKVCLNLKFMGIRSNFT